MADRIGVIDRGRLVQVGTPREIYEDPDNLYVASRLGQPAINVLPPDLLSAGRVPEGTASIGARTEHLRIGKPAKGDGAGSVDWIEHLGDQNHLHVSLGEHKVVTLVDPDTPLARGDRVEVELQRPLFFDAVGQRLRIDGTEE